MATIFITVFCVVMIAVGCGMFILLGRIERGQR